jgi:hypothetical protein
LSFLWNCPFNQDRNVGVLAIICLAVTSIFSGQNYPQKLVGQVAPPLKFEAVLDGSRTLKAPEIPLKGKGDAP